ncbi:sensor histidine kinase [Acidihalobacter yilgarnensis]|uniref:sensor histidine kinase n=1 Tax=Acidihalobacter yilgarnensis TaxID=2819280 RepID=UPI0009F63BEC|nr:ATP-binding protein [Acidihalobacter yilgarnensis]
MRGARGIDGVAPLRRLQRRYALFQTTAFRLSLFYALLYSLLTAVTLGVIYWSTTRYITAQVDAALIMERDGLIHEYHKGGLSALATTVNRRARDDVSGGHFWLILGAGDQRLAGNFLFWPSGLDGGHGFGYINLDNLSIPKDQRADDDDVDVRTLTTPLKQGARLLIGQALSSEEQLADHTFASIAWGVGVVALMSLLGGVLMGRNVLRRLESVSEAAGEIMAGRLSQRIPVAGRGDEFDELAERLNAMLSRIDQLVCGMREVTDNVAHDLRSPLTRLRNRLEVALLEAREATEYREVIEGAVADLEGIIQTFNALLSIAQAEAGMRRKDFSPVDLDALAADLGELYGALAEEAGLQLDFDRVAGACVSGHRDLIAQAVGNLLDNAIKYTPTGGHVRLALSREPGRVRLTVSDSGPGIPDAEHARVMQRFVRLDTARSTPGNGLGLALVKAVAQLHSATVSLGDAQPGLSVTLDFPAL